MSDKKTNSYATKQDLSETKQELLEKLASKEELRSEIAKLATKEELKSEVAKLATKEELKSEVAKLVTKKEFHHEVKRLDRTIEILANQVSNNTMELKKHSGEINSLRGEVYALRAEMDNRFDEMGKEMNEKFNAVLTAIDGLSAQITDAQVEKAAGEHTFRRHENRLDNHEGRIETLEQKEG